MKKYQTHALNWCGIEVQIRYCPDWSGAAAKSYGQAFVHVEVEAVNPARDALPITGTGYKSHFTVVEEIDAAGGVVKFVRAALDHAAQSSEWKELDAQSRQGSLF